MRLVRVRTHNKLQSLVDTMQNLNGYFAQFPTQINTNINICLYFQVRKHIPKITNARTRGSGWVHPDFCRNKNEDRNRNKQTIYYRLMNMRQLQLDMGLFADFCVFTCFYQFYEHIMQKQVKTGKKEEINKQSDVKFWLD